MTDFFRRHVLLITSLGLIVCSFQLLSVSVSDPAFPRLGARLLAELLFPLEKISHEISESVKYVWRHYLWLLDVESERGRFKERIEELEAQNSRLMEQKSENVRMRKLLGFVERSGYHGFTASVVGRDPSNWIKTVTIDRGLDDGVRPGMAVVDGTAVVGQTTVVSRGSAKVLLLTDSSSAIDAIVQSSRATGIVEGGQPSGKLRLRYVEKLPEAPVQAGDRVIASGLDGVFPKGTLIGVVERVDSNTSGLFQVIDVAPSAEVNKLENVLVLVPPEGEPAPPAVRAPQSNELKG